MQRSAFRHLQVPAIAPREYDVGQPVRRKEDDALLRGKGKYTDDFYLPGQLYAWMVRSSHAHGIIRGIDTSAAKAMPGVRGVWTGADFAETDYTPFTCAMPLKNRDGSPLLQTGRRALMSDRVRYVGDPVAFVVADSVAQARDAAEAVVLDIETLPAVTGADAAAQPGAPAALRSHPRQRRAGLSLWQTPPPLKLRLAGAAHITKLDIANTRVAVVAMEPRAALAYWDKSSERYTIHAPTQGVAGNSAALAQLL